MIFTHGHVRKIPFLLTIELILLCLTDCIIATVLQIEMWTHRAVECSQLFTQ